MSPRGFVQRRSTKAEGSVHADAEGLEQAVGIATAGAESVGAVADALSAGAVDEGSLEAEGAADAGGGELPQARHASSARAATEWRDMGGFKHGRRPSTRCGSWGNAWRQALVDTTGMPTRWTLIGASRGSPANAYAPSSAFLRKVVPGLEALVPEAADAGAPIVVQTYRDYKPSRRGWGDVVMVPPKPVDLSPDELEARRHRQVHHRPRRFGRDGGGRRLRPSGLERDVVRRAHVHQPELPGAR